MTHPIPCIHGPLALFLDVDGTLLELAPRPDAVVVPAGLREVLEQAALQQGGALALISGRTIETLDRLFAPSTFAVSGRHGFERRSSDGRRTHGSAAAGSLEQTRLRLRAYVQTHEPLLLEDKGVALAVHYRQAPQLEEQIHTLMLDIAAALSPSFRLMYGKCMVELIPSGYSKRTAIEEFMRETPFRNRIPLFMGDDVTDEDGFEAVNALEGYSVRVGAAGGSTAARYRMTDVASVIAWLRSIAAHAGCGDSCR